MKHGDIVDIYLDYKNNTKFIGTAKLISYIKDDLSFYDDIVVSFPDLPVIYGAERWLVEIVNSCYYRAGFRKQFFIRKVLCRMKSPKSISKYTTYDISNK